MNKESKTERFKACLQAAGFPVDWEGLNEICELLEKAFADIEVMTKQVIDAISAGWPETDEEIEIAEMTLEVVPQTRRRKMERGRAQAIEQRYRAEIHRVERERFYRRIYKPP